MKHIRNGYRILFGNPEGGDHLGYLGVSGIIMLNCILIS
jgi:hypothetical protein